MSKRTYYGADAYRAVLAFAAEQDKTLRADDPRLRRHVLVIHEEGTVLYFRWAFLLRLDEWLLIFTEHHGTHVYHKDDLRLYKQYRPGKKCGAVNWDDMSQIENAVTGWFRKVTPVRVQSARRKTR